MKLKAVKDNILAKPTESQGTILVSSDQYEVISVGADVKEVKVGDIIRVAEYGKVVVDDFIRCKEEDVLAIEEAE